MLNYINGREARPSSLAWILVKGYFQTAIIWTTFLVVIPWLLIAMEDKLGLDKFRFPTRITFWVGFVLFVFGGSLGLVSETVMAIRGKGTPLPADCARELVVAGPYAYVRNPMAIGGLSQGVAVGLMVGSPVVIIFSLLGGPVWNFFVRPWEEADLLKRFGEPYARYRDGVKCWIPNFSRYKL